MRTIAKGMERQKHSRHALLAAIVAAVVLQGAADCITGRVSRVSDGDTVWVTDAARLKHKVRLDRIDAPEKDQPWGQGVCGGFERVGVRQGRACRI